MLILQTIFTDGTKIRASASIKNTWTKEKCERYLESIDKHIESILFTTGIGQRFLNELSQAVAIEQARQTSKIDSQTGIIDVSTTIEAVRDSNNRVKSSI